MNKRMILVCIPPAMMAVVFLPMLLISGIFIENKIPSSVNYGLFYIIGMYGIISVLFPFIIIFLYSITHPSFADKINKWLEAN